MQAKYVQENEEGALAYQLCISDVDADKFIIYERCGIEHTHMHACGLHVQVPMHPTVQHASSVT